MNHTLYHRLFNPDKWDHGWVVKVQDMEYYTAVPVSLRTEYNKELQSKWKLQKKEGSSDVGLEDRQPYLPLTSLSFWGKQIAEVFFFNLAGVLPVGIKPITYSTKKAELYCLFSVIAK